MGRETKADLLERIAELEAQLAALGEEEGTIVLQNIHDSHVTISRKVDVDKFEQYDLAPLATVRVGAGWLKEYRIQQLLNGTNRMGKKLLAIALSEAEGKDIYAIMRHPPEEVSVPDSAMGRDMALQIALYDGDNIERPKATGRLGEGGDRASIILDYLELKPVRPRTSEQRTVTIDWIKRDFLLWLRYARYLEQNIKNRPKVLELLDHHIKRVEDMPLTYAY